MKEFEDDLPKRRTRAKAASPDEREAALISLAMDRAEKQIAEGTASSQVLVHFAKLGSSRERLEQQRLRGEIEVLEKKVEAMEAAVDIKNLMDDALKAFRGYTGREDEYSEDDYDDYDD